MLQFDMHGKELTDTTFLRSAMRGLLKLRFILPPLHLLVSTLSLPRGLKYLSEVPVN